MRPREAREEIAPEALEVGRVPFQGCLKAKLPGCAASELRRRRTRLRRLPQREGAQRVWPHLPLSSQRSLADIYWIEACSAAEHEMAADSKQGVALAAGIPVHGGNEANAEAVQSRQPELHLPSPELVGVDAGQSQRSMATPVAIITEVTDGYLQGSSLLSGRT